MQAPILPNLRSDLEFISSEKTETGPMNWTIHDPLQHRYFRIDAETKDILDIWRGGLNAEALSEKAARKLGKGVSRIEIDKLHEFLSVSNLLETESTNSWQELVQRAEKGKKSLLSKLVGGHLFFKIPLVKPTKFLSATEHLVRPLYSRTGIWLILLFGLLGLYLAARDLSAVRESFPALLTFSGSASFLIALFIVKVIHELGHAYVATRFHCKIPTMGVAFMVMVPVLYTDITDTWRLKDRRQRMWVSGAGIIAELFVASVATFLWVFWDPGFVRDMLLILATTSWVMSLAVNLNPMMKFDGYYLLSDLLGIENLQSRGFEYTRWKIRQSLIASNVPAAEQCTARMAWFFVVYSIATWIYRVFIFTAIVLFVYHFTFKLLGILLFALEVWILLFRPIFKELREWPKIFISHGSAGRVFSSSALALVALFGLLYPWSTTVRVPVILSPIDLNQVYTPQAARILDLFVERGQHVRVGDPLLHLEVPQLHRNIEAARIEVAQIEMQLKHGAASNNVRDETIVLSQEYMLRSAKLSGLENVDQNLIIRAPISGYLVQLEDNLHKGRWVSRDTLIALISNQTSYSAKGYIPEEHLKRVDVGSAGEFIPDDPSLPSFGVRVNSISPASSKVIKIPELLEANGSLISVKNAPELEPVPSEPQYSITFDLEEEIPTPRNIVRGVICVDGEGQSIGQKILHSIARVFVRESVF